MTGRRHLRSKATRSVATRKAADAAPTRSPWYESELFKPGPFAIALIVSIAVSLPAVASVVLLVAVAVLVLAFAASRIDARRR